MHLLTWWTMLLAGCLGLTSVCQAQLSSSQAQECKCRKVQLPTRLSYTGIVEIPPDYNATGNRFFTLELSKLVTESDTLFFLGLSIQAVNVSAQADSATVTFQFSNGSSLFKVKQPLHVLLMTKGNALLSTNVRLTRAELVSLTANDLVSITIVVNNVLVADEVAKSIRKVSSCILTVW